MPSRRSVSYVSAVFAALLLAGICVVVNTSTARGEAPIAAVPPPEPEATSIAAPPQPPPPAPDLPETTPEPPRKQPKKMRRAPTSTDAPEPPSTPPRPTRVGRQDPPATPTRVDPPPAPVPPPAPPPTRLGRPAPPAQPPAPAPTTRPAEPPPARVGRKDPPPPAPAPPPTRVGRKDPPPPAPAPAPPPKPAAKPRIEIVDMHHYRIEPGQAEALYATARAQFEKLFPKLEKCGLADIHHYFNVKCTTQRERWQSLPSFYMYLMDDGKIDDDYSNGCVGEFLVGESMPVGKTHPGQWEVKIRILRTFRPNPEGGDLCPYSGLEG